MTKTYILIKKYVHSKRKSNSILWKRFFEIRDCNFTVKVENIRSKINEYRWLHHRNITKKYKDTLYRGFEKVLETKTFKCNPYSNVELHTVSGHFHLTMYLVAVKSLLRFYDDIAVVVHDGDNTLSNKDIRILNEHIKGIRVIKKTYADKNMKKILDKFPSTLKYRSKVVNSFELLDNLTFAKTSKVITMNSDVLFLEKPTELIKWAKLKKPPITYVYEDRPAMQKEFLKEMKRGFKPHLKVFNTKKYESSGVFKKKPIFRHYWSSLGTFMDLHISDAKKIIGELK